MSFTVDGIVSDDVARALARRGVFVSNGDFYATTVIERLGHAADGVVRAGCACYTTDEEVDRLIEGVAARSAQRLNGAATAAQQPRADCADRLLAGAPLPLHAASQ